jgi:hypothetical protein
MRGTAEVGHFIIISSSIVLEGTVRCQAIMYVYNNWGKNIHSFTDMLLDAKWHVSAVYPVKLNILITYTNITL